MQVADNYRIDAINRERLIEQQSLVLEQDLVKKALAREELLLHNQSEADHRSLN